MPAQTHFSQEKRCPRRRPDWLCHAEGRGFESHHPLSTSALGRLGGPVSAADSLRRLHRRLTTAGNAGVVSGDPYRWDERVEAWEEVAAGAPFLRLRDRIVELAQPQPDDVAVDLGAGTGLLALALAAQTAEVVAVDISPRMLARLDAAAADEGIRNLRTLEADLRRLPLDDESATLVVSNYAFHHLDDAGKELALSEARRVLRPGGRLVVCDMMFSLSLAKRDRRLILEKVAAMLRRGPAGVLRILRNAARLAAGRWEQPARPETWEAMLRARGFEGVRVELLEHEAAIAVARRPELSSRGARARAVPAASSGS